MYAVAAILCASVLVFLVVPTTGFVRTVGGKRSSFLLAKISAEDRAVLGACHVMVALPLASVPVNELTNLKKGLPKSSNTSVLPMNDIIELVDGTPFCILGSVVKGVNLCIFITNNEDYEYFNNWMKKMTSSQTNNFIACKKGHLIRYK